MEIKKIIASFLTLSFLSLFVAPAQAATTTKTTSTTVAKSTLAANTPININLADEISTNAVATGTEVNFTVANDVKDSKGNILIRTGAPVSAHVSYSKPKARIGRSGEVIVSDFSTTAVDGTKVPLTGTVSDKAKTKMKLSITLSVIICPLFLLMRGKDAIIPAGTTSTVYTTSNVSIKPAKI